MSSSLLHCEVHAIISLPVPVFVIGFTSFKVWAKPIYFPLFSPQQKPDVGSSANEMSIKKTIRLNCRDSFCYRHVLTAEEDHGADLPWDMFVKTQRWVALL